jgi:hypothetical protein
MPNLRAILDGNVLGLAPDVYLRDFVGDTGAPHPGAISASPDVILRQAVEPNPQAAFGEGSGTENSQTLGFEAEAGQDNFIYVRARNPMRLLVQIPEAYRDRPYEVFARQLFERQEVGRVTWRLSRPPKRSRRR